MWCGGAALALVYRFSQWLHPQLAGADGSLTWVSWLLEWGVFGVAAVAALLPLLAVWKVLELILFGVAYAKITESVERELLALGETIRPLTMLQDLTDAVRNAIILVLGFIAIFLLNLAPFVGSLLGLAIGLLWGAFVQGLDLIGVCRALRGDRRLAQYRFCWLHGFETLGLGIVGFSLGVIPILGPVIVASCAVGAALLHRDIEISKEDV